jgi:hypothetical protein
MFVTKEDIKNVIGEKRFAAITIDPPDAADAHIQWAMDVISDTLIRFDMQSVFAQRGEKRNTIAIQWVVDLALYRLYEKVADRQIPERIIKNYDDVRFQIAQIGIGKATTSLPLKQSQSESEAQSAPKTQFRWGSQKPRSH